MLKTIMLVDDDRTSNFLNKKILKNLYPDFSVIDFLSSEEALGYLTGNLNNFPDIILLDINMPDIDGWEFIEELRRNKIDNHSSIIMLSSSIDEGDMEKSKGYKEVKGFITKPLRIDIFDRLLK